MSAKIVKILHIDQAMLDDIHNAAALESELRTLTDRQLIYHTKRDELRFLREEIGTQVVWQFNEAT
jgi:hypothetical protein